MGSRSLIPLLSRGASEVTVADLEFLCKHGVAESDQLEFKSDLPEGGGRKWSESRRITDKTRDALLKEIVAFANAHGGVLLLGVEESDGHPKVAKALTPLADCHDLAERLRQCARDCIEPLLPHCEIEPVSHGTEGHGLVVLRVGPSRVAPHWVRGTRSAAFRRRDRSVDMGMREIQDLTIERYLAASRVEQLFQEETERWQSLIGRYVTSPPAQDGRAQVSGFRVTAAPSVGTLQLVRVYRHASLYFPRLSPFEARARHAGGAETTLQVSPCTGHTLNARPILRGVTWRDSTLRKATEDGKAVHVDFESQGRICFRFIELVVTEPRQATITSERPGLCIPWIMNAVGNMLRWVEAVRRVGGAPSLEFGLELQIDGSCGVPIFPFFRLEGERTLLRLEGGRQLFPRLSVGPREEFPDLLRQVYEDVFTACGQMPSYAMDFGDVLGILDEDGGS